MPSEFKLEMGFKNVGEGGGQYLIGNALEHVKKLLEQGNTSGDLRTEGVEWGYFEIIEK